MSITFSAPGSGGGGSSVTPADLEGHVVVIEPTEYVAAITTSFGEKDAVRATIHDISEQATHEDCLLFPGGLIAATKGRIGERVLGVIGKGTAKPGQAAPWIITDASSVPAAVEAATAYLTTRVAASITAPAAPAPAAAPAAPTSALDAALGNLAASGLTK